MKKLAIFIGRFQPVHDGHLNVVRHACNTSDKLLILVGSSHAARDMRNPWSYGQRVAMLKRAIKDAGVSLDKVHFEPLHDHLYQDNAWTQQVQRYARHYAGEEKVQIKLHGHDKDETTWYIKAFPQWGEPVTEAEFNQYNATDIRDQFFDPSTDPLEIEGISNSVKLYLDDYKRSHEYDYIVEEYKFQDAHDARWENREVKDYLKRVHDNIGILHDLAEKNSEIKHLAALLTPDLLAQAIERCGTPYKVSFNTVDSIVVQSGHILLVRRKNHPGKGCWAIPGGYIETEEAQLKSAIRELREETCLKVPEKVLRGSLISAETFDEPKRSTRGRIITRVFYFQLQDDHQLPRIKGDDDADKAQWITLDDFLHMREQMFEDHYHIIRKMLNI